MKKIIAECYTDIGSFRDNNEDAIFCRAFQKKNHTLALGVVCDGIGGMEHGEVASGYIISRVEKWFETITSWIDLVQCDHDLIHNHLMDAAEEWNLSLYEYFLNNGFSGGTTMSALLILDMDYYIIHVGDSRIYVYYPNQELHQLTADASVTQLYGGRMRSFLDNYMGKQKELWFQERHGKLHDGDMFLFGSDGFYHYMTLRDIHTIYNNTYASDKVERALQKYVRAMMQRGERDNISIGIICQKNSRMQLRKLGNQCYVD